MVRSPKPTSSTRRRSSREKRAVTTIYDDAVTDIENTPKRDRHSGNLHSNTSVSSIGSDFQKERVLSSRKKKTRQGKGSSSAKKKEKNDKVDDSEIDDSEEDDQPKKKKQKIDAPTSNRKVKSAGKKPKTKRSIEESTDDQSNDTDDDSAEEYDEKNQQKRTARKAASTKKDQPLSNRTPKSTKKSPGKKSASPSSRRRMQPKNDESNSENSDESEEEEYEEKTPVKKIKKKTVQPNRRVVAKPTSKGTRGKKNKISLLLKSLAKKVLDEDETPETSLIAALLEAGIENDNKETIIKPFDSQSGVAIRAPSYYSYLEPLIRHWILDKHHGANGNDADPLQVQTELINLIFRSVGGTTDSFLDASAIENMNSEEWDRVINNLVDDMRYTPEDKVLFLLSNYDLDGKFTEKEQNLKNMSTKAKSTTAAKEDTIWGFRHLWDDFWYALVHISFKDGEENNTGRFALEMIRDWNLRLHELLEIGQPDIRGAAVTASLQMALAVLDQTVSIHTRLNTVTERQYQSAMKRNTKKAAALLENQIQPQKRLLEELEEIVDTNISAVFVNRYRDSNPVIRGYALHFLSQITLRRPDLYLRDKYLKYIGWTLSDKSSQVRCAALDGLLSPFQRQQQVQQRQQVESQALTAAKKKKDAGKILQLEEETSMMLIDNVDLSTCLTKVVRKFLSRLADCTIDVSTRVQEKAMSLFLHLDRSNFLDDFEDELLWEQINNRALAEDTTPAVRRDALYFIMDQLEAFDDGLMDEDEIEDSDNDEPPQKRSRQWAKDKKASLVHSEETLAAKKIGSLAGWIAHSLTNSPIPLDQIHLSLTDYVVESLRSMPEHSRLVTLQWSAIVRAINDCCEEDTTTAIKMQTAKQRVLVRILSHAARLEFGEVTGLSNEGNSKKTTQQRKGNKSKKSTSQEIFGKSLLPVLSDLLRQFQTDPFALNNLAFLPRYLCGFTTMPQSTKKPFVEIVQTMAQIYETKTNHELCLQTILESLVLLSKTELITTNVDGTNSITGNIRAPEAQKQLQLLGKHLCHRLMKLWNHDNNDKSSQRQQKKSTKSLEGSQTKKSRKKKGRKSSVLEQLEEANDNDSGIDAHFDNEFVIASCLQRLSILAKRIDLGRGKSGLSEKEHETLRNSTFEGMKRRLEKRQIIMRSSTDDMDSNDSSSSSKDNDPMDQQSSIIIPSIWNEQDDPKFHEACSQSVRDTLDFLLVSLAWDLKKAKAEDPLADMENNENEEEEDINEADEGDSDIYANHKVVLHRDRLVEFLSLCFRQFLPTTHEDDFYSINHIIFADCVQTAAMQSSSDLRTLLPKVWADESVASPMLRAFALTNDQELTVASVRYFRSKEHELRAVEDQEVENSDRVFELLLPICRSSVANFSVINRRETAFALSHLIGSGKLAQNIITSLSDVLKGMDPVRLLETHMICLRTSFEDWLNSEPAEIESEIPTDEEMMAFEKAEEEHQNKFDFLLEQATCLAKTLDNISKKSSVAGSGGAKKLLPRLNKPILGFLKEGIRYAFSTTVESGHDEEEDFLPGGRLTFLLLLQDYGKWIRRNKNSIKQLQEIWSNQIQNLRADPDFDQAHEDDLSALDTFAKCMGFAATNMTITNPAGPTIVEDDEEEDGEDGDNGKYSETPTTPRDSHSSHSNTPSSTPTSGGSSSSDRQSKSQTNARRRLSRGSLSTNRSAHTMTLSPLLEEEADDNEKESSSPARKLRSPMLSSPTAGRRRGGFKRSSVGSALSMTTLDEENDDDSEYEENMRKKRKRKSISEVADDDDDSFSTQASVSS